MIIEKNDCTYIGILVCDNFYNSLTRQLKKIKFVCTVSLTMNNSAE